MKPILKRLAPVLAALTLLAGLLPAAGAAEPAADTVRIVLNDAATTVDGALVTEDPAAAVYRAAGSTIDHYEAEYAAEYGSAYGEAADASQWHTAEECDRETHIVITQPGTYEVSGTLYGQLSVELDSKKDPSAVVTLIFNGADITCDIAPAVLFVKAYEYDPTAYEDDNITITLEQAMALNHQSAGAQVVIADGSVNHISGSHVAKCYAYTVGEDGALTFTKKEDGSAKKRVKYDGAFYSKVSMTISGGELGTGVLNITADNEGLNSEQHLVITGGCINIASQDDGINTNDEQGSVTRIDGGCVTINAGLGVEGDGIDSNGYLIINGGTVFACGKPASDSGIDADLGSVINGGTVIALGSSMDQVSVKSTQASMMLKFAAQQAADAELCVKDSGGKNVLTACPAAVLDEAARGYGCAILSAPELQVGDTYTVWSDGAQLAHGGVTESAEGHGFGRPGGMELPEGFRPEMQGMGQRPQMPDGFEPPAGMMPEGSARPEEWPKGARPDGFDRGEGFGRPEGMEPPVGFGPGTSGEVGSNREFTLTALTNVFSSVGTAKQPQSMPFRDVDPVRDAAYVDAIRWAAEKEITSGTTEATFSPNNGCTRGQIVTFLWRAAGEPKVEDRTCPFADVSEDNDCYEAVLWACQQGITRGIRGDAFAPDMTCTRGQVMTFLYRFVGMDTMEIKDNPFTDITEGMYCYDAVLWGAKNGITGGTTATTFSPNAGCTRAQAVTFLYRFSRLTERQ